MQPYGDHHGGQPRGAFKQQQPVVAFYPDDYIRRRRDGRRRKNPRNDKNDGRCERKKYKSHYIPDAKKFFHDFSLLFL